MVVWKAALCCRARNGRWASLVDVNAGMAEVVRARWEGAANAWRRKRAGRRAEAMVRVQYRTGGSRVVWCGECCEGGRWMYVCGVVVMPRTAHIIRLPIG